MAKAVRELVLLPCLYWPWVTDLPPPPRSWAFRIGSRLLEDHHELNDVVPEIEKQPSM